jgi:7-carboxy-7-deazaguanine synthase
VKYPLAPHGVFWTIQGEGALQGEPMAFIRLAGCSIGCAQCDTDYRVNRRVALSDLVSEALSVVPAGFARPWVWLTGGEPTDHNLMTLAAALRSYGFVVALATSGKRAVPNGLADWLSVSPHSLEIQQRNGHELKVVPELNGLSWDAVTELGRLSFPYRYLQPMAGPESQRSEQACIAFVQQHPGWRLGVQAHKGWGLP